MNFAPLLNAARALGPLAKLGTSQLRQALVLAGHTVTQVVVEELPTLGPAVGGLLAGPVRDLITKKATGRVAAVLLARLGLRGVLASTVAGLLVPLVLEIAVRRALKTNAWARFATSDQVEKVRQVLTRPFRRAAPETPTGA